MDATGTLCTILERIAKDLHERGKFDPLYRRDLYDGEKRSLRLGKTKRGKGKKPMAVADGAGIPLAVHATSALPHEITLVLDTLKEQFLRQRSIRLIGDRAYDDMFADGRPSVSCGAAKLPPSAYPA